MARWMRLVAVALGLVLLCGCAPFTFQNVNDLLHAPKLGSGEGEIQKALEAYLEGAQPQYKYPKEGEGRSPLVRADLDGDGEQEAILLYSLDDSTALGREKSGFVYVAVLRNTADGWQVVYDEQGLMTDVASLEVADLLGSGPGGERQLIVGYASTNLNNRTLALYTWRDNRLNKLYQYDYSRYLIGDFTGRGGNDLVVVSRDDDAGGLSMHYVPTRDGRFLLDEPAEAVKLDANFQSCAGIAPGAGRDGERILVVDGVNATDGGALSSQFVYYGNERFFTVDDAGYMRGATGRLNPLLRSRDIDGDGVVEIPLRFGRNKITTPAGEKNMEYVIWWDYSTQETPVAKEFGLVDSDRSVYIRLPEGWQGQVEVVDVPGAKTEWRLQRSRTLTTLLSLQIIEAGESVPIGAIRVPGTTGVYLVLQRGLSEEESNAIQMTSLS